MALYQVGRQIPNATNAARALESRLRGAGAFAVGVYAAGEIQTPTISWTVLTQAMRAQMQAIQRRAVANIEESLVRPEESTGRLSKVTGSPKNAKLFTEAGRPTGFGVGLTTYLNSSEARMYWRAIEEGSAKFVGRRLRILPEGGYEPTRGRTLLQDPGLRTMPGGWVRVNRAILAHHYYRDAWRETDTPARMERAMMEWARANGLPLRVRGVGESRRYGALRI